MTTWIDFRELRQRLDFAAVLRHYGVELKVKGEQHQGFCPLPTHQGRKRSPSFSANLVKGIWQCFGCGAKGNILDFAVRMAGFGPHDRQGLRQTALWLQEKFGTAEVANKSPPKAVSMSSDGLKSARNPESSSLEATVVNAPLDFQLKALDPQHPYLRKRGLTTETIRYFGLGYCRYGLLKNRIAIPLHDPVGHLIGYAGRLVNDAVIDENHPKYRLPGKRERKGSVYEFKKSFFLYHGYRIRPPVLDLIVVEGFPAVWWLWQAGYKNVVGLMGASCSPEQAALIVGLVPPIGRVWVFPDGDPAGERCATSVLEQVARHRFVRWVVVGPGKQPTDYSASEIKNLLSEEVIPNDHKL